MLLNNLTIVKIQSKLYCFTMFCSCQPLKSTWLHQSSGAWSRGLWSWYVGSGGLIGAGGQDRMGGLGPDPFHGYSRATLKVPGLAQGEQGQGSGGREDGRMGPRRKTE